MKRVFFAAIAAVMCAGALASAQALRQAQGEPQDFNGIWGVAPLPPAAKPGESVRWLLPLRGVNPEGTDVFKGLDRVQVTAGLSPGERVVVRGALLLDGSAEALL